MVIIADDEQLEQCKSVLLGQSVLALDCEGVHLGRLGTVSLIQLGVRGGPTFLFDVADKDASSEVVLFLKGILEDEGVVKIIHDCRQDSDALLHLLGIRLARVHDTSALSDVRQGLNATLEYYECPVSVMHDPSVYNTNPEFWATRPLTADMIARAAGDIDNLFLLRDKQQVRLEHQETEWAARLAVQECNLTVHRDAVVCCFSIDPALVGQFVGKGGANVNELREALGVSFSLRSGLATDQVVCYAPDKAMFGAVEAALRIYRIAPTHRFEIQAPDLGRFIGAKGANVRQLGKFTHTLINVQRGTNTFVVRPRDDMALQSLAAELQSFNAELIPCGAD